MLNLSAVIAWHVPAITAERVFEHDRNALTSGYPKIAVVPNYLNLERLVSM